MNEKIFYSSSFWSKWAVIRLIACWIVLSCASYSIAQTNTPDDAADMPVFKAEIVELNSTLTQQIYKNLVSFQVIELDVQRINHYVKTNPYSAKFTLQIGDQSETIFDLKANEMRSENYRAIRTTEEGEVEVAKQPNFTFKGQINERPDQITRLSILPNQIKGFFQQDENDMFIEPLSGLTTEAVPGNYFVLYEFDDIAPIPGAFCGVTEMEELENQLQLPRNNDRMMDDCIELEIATDADFEWFEMYGANSNDEILTNLNMVQGVYQLTFNMNFVIVFQNVWETSSDPYTASGSPSSAILAEIRAEWNTNNATFVAVQRDLVHVFSAKNHGGLLGSVSGGLPGVCTDPDVSHGFTADRVGAFLTTAHEIGHNFNGVHGDGTGCGAVGASIMCQGLEKSLFFSAASTTTIQNYIDANGECMTECGCELIVDCTLLPNITVPCVANIPPANQSLLIIIDACGDLDITDNDVVTMDGDGCPGTPRVIERTYSISDFVGNSTSCEQTITVISNNDPTITCPATKVVTCISEFNLAANLAEVTATVECGIPTITRESGPTLDAGEPDNCNGATYTVTYRATDYCNRFIECEQQVAIINNPPEMWCDPDETVDCAEDINPSKDDIMVTWSCGVDTTFQIIGPTIIGQPNCEFTAYQYTYKVTDACGREAMCTRSYIIENDGPDLTIPPDANIACEDDSSPAGPAGQATATASCDLGVDVTYEDEGEVDICEGYTITRTWTATDDCGRTDVGEQLIEVDPALDPVITFCPPSALVNCPQDIVTTPEDVEVDYDCGVSGQVFVSGPVINGEEGCPNTTYTYTYTVIDDCGNSNVDPCIQVFTIIAGGENVGPTIDVVEELTVDCFEAINPNPDWADITTGCGDLIDATVTVSNPVLISNSGFNCPNTKYRVIFTVEDACERIDTAHQIYTIQNDGPTMACPDNCEVFSCYDGNYRDIIDAWINTVTATSSCSDDLTVYNSYTQSNDYLNGICITNGVTPVRFYAYDDCNRLVECFSQIIIIDDDAPDVYVQPQDLLIPCTINTPSIYNDWLADNGGAAAVDACGGPVYWTYSASQALNCEGGPQAIEVDFTATDGCGNSTTVSAVFTTKLLPLAVNVAGAIQTEAASAVSAVQVAAYQSSGMMEMDVSNETGDYSFEELPYEDNTEIVPSRDGDYLNGLSTYDLILLQMHILGVQDLNSPYKRIAADANRSGSISTLDLVLLRRLILHIDEELEDNTSWRFVDANYVFPNPQNPFETDFPEVYSLTGLEEEMADFIAVKIGDLNLDAQTSNFSPSEDRSSLDVLKVQTEDQLLRAGQEYKIDLSAANFTAINGFQFTLNFDQTAIEILDIQSADLGNFATGNYGMSKVNEGAVTISWNSNEAQSMTDEEAIFSVVLRAQTNVKLSEVLAISSVYTKAEAYRNAELMNVDLSFLASGLETAYKHFKLFQNQPNPFMDATTIGFILPEAGEVTLEVYTATGKLVHVERNDFAKGYQQIDLDRSQLPIGVLYYKVSTVDRSDAKRMLLLE